MYIKRFLEWINLKEKLHNKIISAPYVNEGEISWASIGENVGLEINGKSKLFTRPVIIFKKLTHNYYYVIPATTKTKTGTWYVSYKQSNIHARSIDYRRLDSKLGELNNLDFKRIKEGFRKLYL